MRRTAENLERTRPTQVGLMSYDEWRTQEADRLAGTARLDVDVRFAVVVERAPGETELHARTVTGLPAGAARGVPAGATVRRADLGDAEFVLFLRNGSELRADALARITKAHHVDPSTRVITFDSDLIGPRDEHTDPHFRPSWSPEMLLGANYLGRAFAIRASELPDEVVVDDRGIWRLLLSLDLADRQVAAVPEVLLSEPHRERVPDAADAEMVAAELTRRGEPATATAEAGVVHVEFERESWPKVSIVIPSRHSRQNLGRLLPSLARTDYEHFDVTIVDNGGESPENAEWYETHREGLDLNVIWWTETPFNYSHVNNAGVAATDGEVVIMLNDDTEIVDRRWMKELVAHVTREGVGTVGMRLLQGEGLIQHGGVMVGPGGFADNLFTGMRPGDDTLLGPTTWYRNSLAVTGACVAIERADFDRIGGLDERFVLMGSDVVLGLDMVISGKRNVVLPFDMVRHYESITRGSTVPTEDLYASYWRYYPWLLAGDPYSSPNVSRLSAVPRFHYRFDPKPVELALTGLGRPIRKEAQSMSIAEEANSLLGTSAVTAADVARVHELHREHADAFPIETINWFIPEIDMPFFGGLNTAFRLAAKLTREHGVRNRFVVLGLPNELYVKSALAAAFPELADVEVVFYDGSDDGIASIPPADAAIATLWLTADHVARTTVHKRHFYLMQDYEPAFYPASTMYALAEETYRLGLYGICNTSSMHRIYTGSYGGKAIGFTPAVDRAIYHPEGRRVKGDDEPVTIFAYARDHFRNCWELVFTALSAIKRLHGDRVRIVVAGARYLDATTDFVDLKLLDYRQTAQIYREADIGLTMQISRHPSYLPLELMACGVPMVAPDSEWFKWLFADGVNSKLSMRSLADLVEKLDLLVRDADLRAQLSAGALETIDARHSDWDAALDGVYAYLCDPEREAQTPETTPQG
jgi:GT2 family glycosyltransferase/glycosyltransferase involved in cell wall biosynthesis